MASPIVNPSNPLLLKAEIGKPKPPVHKLPSSNFTYGKSAGHDQEGAKEVVNGWKFHEPTPSIENSIDFKKLNALSIKNGACDAKEIKEFRKGRNISQPKQSSNIPVVKMTLPDDNFLHGMPNKPSTPINLVISNNYGNKAAALTSEKYANKKPEVKSTQPKINNSAQLKKSVTSKKLQDKTNDSKKPDDVFKLQQFKNVPSKIAAPK